MLLTAGTALLLAASGGVVAPADRPPVAVHYAQLRIREQVIVRVPTRRHEAAPQSRPTRWKEKRGPRCIPANALAGASVNENDSVDLLLRGGARVRAEIESHCPALDYYSGFYLRPGADGKICADRDAIHARSGGKCEIERFRKLVPER